MSSQVFDSRVCQLGEGPLWHPLRKQLFWFDILGKRLLSQNDGKALEWQFDEHVSAAGWVDQDRLLIASETQLFLFDVTEGTSHKVIDLEADNPATRSNDGRADPKGGFWIGTMGKQLEANAGKIYRYYKGELRVLFENISISNAICFSPDGKRAYFADTPEQSIKTVALDDEGWPTGDVEVFVDLSSEDLNPDGAVVDAEGCIWNAQWGASRIACYAPDGRYLKSIPMGATQTSCPAFGGEDLTDLFATTAEDNAPEGDDLAGQVFVHPNAPKGQAEHQVIL